MRSLLCLLSPTLIAALPTTSFWKSAVAEKELSDFDPIATSSFKILQSDRVATAGSCFAQHISKALIREGVRFVQGRGGRCRGRPPSPDILGALRQYLHLPTAPAALPSSVRPVHAAPLGLDAGGWSLRRSVPAKRVSRRLRHHRRAGLGPRAPSRRGARGARELRRLRLHAGPDRGLDLRRGRVGRAVAPPGVVAAPANADETFSPVNLSVHELTEDLLTFIDDMRLVNPSVRFMITVSPVPIIATFEQRHVIVSNAYSKAVLRVVWPRMRTSERRDVFYFPSYEMIVTHPKARHFDQNLRADKAGGRRRRHDGLQAAGSVARVGSRRSGDRSARWTCSRRRAWDSPSRPIRRFSKASSRA